MITIPGIRVHLKRILFGGLIWTCLCLIVLHVSKSDTDHRKPWETPPGQNRELLQNLLPVDYNPFPGITTNSQPSPSSALVHPSFDAQSSQNVLKVDTRPSPSESDLLLSLSDVSNLPLAYWTKIKKTLSPKKKGPSPNCKPEFPSLYELDFNNIHWQRFTSTNGTFYLYGAYYDDRWRGGPLPMVRILSMIDRVNPPPIACQFWFDSFTTPILSPASYIYGWYPKWGNYKDGLLQPWVITCKVPRIKGLKKGTAPDSVSLVQTKCDTRISNNLRVINERPPVKEKFAVCVKGLDFATQDLSVRLVEWLELLKILGASKVFLYELEIHPNISKVLDHYVKSGLVKLTPITLPGDQPNLPGFRHLYLKNKLTAKRQNEIIPYNDCLYRNLYTYEYLALLDIDEIIMPLQHMDWYGLMDQVQKESLSEKNYTRASYNVRNVYFLEDMGGSETSENSGNILSENSQVGENSGAIVEDSAKTHNGQVREKHTGHEVGIPRYLHMLQHVYRSRNYTKPGQYVKCFHNTERVVCHDISFSLSISFYFLFRISSVISPSVTVKRERMQCSPFVGTFTFATLLVLAFPFILSPVFSFSSSLSLISSLFFFLSPLLSKSYFSTSFASIHLMQGIKLVK